MFKVTYKYSACVVVSTDDVSILCDPWFSDAAYYGTWAQFPKYHVSRSFIGEFDCIYISHIHPDHYCPHTLRNLLRIYGPKPIIVARRINPNYLLKKLCDDGFGSLVSEVDYCYYGGSRVDIIPVHTGSVTDIDSSLLVSCVSNRYAFLNANDCYITHDYASALNSKITTLDLDVRLFALGYTGAGPYPQTYYSFKSDLARLASLAARKSESFTARYKSSIDLIKSRRRLPFAGKYLLSGVYSELNPYRGVLDAVDILSIDDGALVIEDGGHHFFDLETLEASAVRSTPYNFPHHIPQANPFLWETLVNFKLSRRALLSLTHLALSHAHSKSQCEDDFLWSLYVLPDNICISTVWNTEDPTSLVSSLISFNCNKHSTYDDIPSEPSVHGSLFIPERAFISALLGLTHWNNYEIGSVYQTRRHPDVYQPSMYSFLYFLHI